MYVFIGETNFRDYQTLLGINNSDITANAVEGNGAISTSQAMPYWELDRVIA